MLAWMILTAVICVLLGIILTLVVEWHLFSQPTRKLQGDDDIDPLLNGDKSIPLELPPVCFYYSNLLLFLFLIIIFYCLISH